MERRWPWKKKSSDKAALERAATAAILESATASLVSVGSLQNQQENYKKPNYVQISAESYTHLTGLENQVKTYQEQFQTLDNQVKTYEEQFQTLENQIEELNEKLSQAWSEVETKEELVKQHAKVAEDAVLGWEKAETEVIALQSQVDSLRLSKRTAEDRATHLDGALKDYVQQIRKMKDEHAQELREAIFTKTIQWDKTKHELEAKIANLDQQLIMADAENAALLRSLQERGNLIVQINEEKSQAEAETEFLKGKIESCEKEINLLKYELHVASKELEIRTEEKNMAVKSADVANKQNLEGVKKITKLEAECQRLRGLVRKKLPGPAALAQMRSEVETLAREYGDTGTKRPPSKPSSPYSPLPQVNFDNQQDKEFLMCRLLAMEEEMKMLKEALAKRNSELQVSRNECAKTTSKLQSLEALLHNHNKKPLKTILASTTHSMGSMSDDDIDDPVSCAESWTTASASEISQSHKGKLLRPRKSEVNQLELMDDFLEMEKLAQSNWTVTHPENVDMKSQVSHSIDEDVAMAISQIKTFVLSKGHEIRAVRASSGDIDGLIEKIEKFYIATEDSLHGNGSLTNFVTELAHILSAANKFNISIIVPNSNAGDNSSSACVDKVALPENRVTHSDIMKERYQSGCSGIPDTLHPELSPERNSAQETESITACSASDAFKELMLEKERLTANLEDTTSQLFKAEKLLEELKSQLVAAEGSNSLLETRLKCMAQSYRSLEEHAKDLEKEIDILREKTKSLEFETQEETKSNHTTLETCNHLGELSERNRDFSASPGSETGFKMQQEIELAAAAEKLAKCQETISHLGKQFESPRPEAEVPVSPQSVENQLVDTLDQTEEEAVASLLSQSGSHSQLKKLYADPSSPSDSEVSTLSLPPTSSSKLPKLRHTMSGSSLPSAPTPEKYTRASFGRIYTSRRRM